MVLNSVLPTVLALEDGCPASLGQVEAQRQKYLEWTETYQNPLSPAFKIVKGTPLPRAILFNAGNKYNFTFRVVARGLNESSSLIASDADLKVNSPFSASAFQEVHLSTPYSCDYVTFSVKAPSNEPNERGFVDVFSPEVWTSLIITSILCTIVIYLLSFSFLTRQFTLTARHSVAFILKNFIIEGHTLIYPESAVQVFASVWIFVAFVTSTLYLSVVVSSVLSHEPSQSIPETFEDLIRYKMKVKSPITDMKDVTRFLVGSQKLHLQYLATSVSAVKYLVNCQDASLHEPNTACVAKFRGMRIMLETKYTDDSGAARIVISKHHGPAIWIGFAIRKDSPYKDIISQFISRTTATGLVDFWTHSYDHAFRRWGAGMGIGDDCTNQVELFRMWGVAAEELNRPNENKHIFACYWWDLQTYKDLVKNFCIKPDGTGTEGNAMTDSMLRVKHLRIIFKVSAFWYSTATICFLFEFCMKNTPRLSWVLRKFWNGCKNRSYVCMLFTLYHNSFGSHGETSQNHVELIRPKPYDYRFEF